MTIQQQKNEEYYLNISLFASLLSVAILFCVGFFSHSTATLLDGVIGLIDISTTVAVIFTIKLLKKPATAQHQFGFYKFEPLIIALESGIIAVVCIQAILDAIKSFYHGDVVLNYYHGFLLMSVNFVINLVATYYLYHANKTIKSKVIVVEYKGWFLETLTEMALWFSFLIGVYVQFFRLDVLRPYLIYLDPTLTIIITLSVIREPINIFVSAIKELVDAKPEEWVNEEKLIDSAKQFATQSGFSLQRAKMVTRQSGRAVFINLIYTPDDIQNVAQLYQFEDRLKDYIVKLSNSIVTLHCILTRKSEIATVVQTFTETGRVR